MAHQVACPRPQCRHGETRVRFKRLRLARIERNRECCKCGYRFWTVQHPEVFLRASRAAPV